jgi:hypothetical protein
MYIENINLSISYLLLIQNRCAIINMDRHLLHFGRASRAWYVAPQYFRRQTAKAEIKWLKLIDSL